MAGLKVSASGTRDLVKCDVASFRINTETSVFSISEAGVPVLRERIGFFLGLKVAILRGLLEHLPEQVPLSRL